MTNKTKTTNQAHAATIRCGGCCHEFTITLGLANAVACPSCAVTIELGEDDEAAAEAHEQAQLDAVAIHEMQQGLGGPNSLTEAPYHLNAFELAKAVAEYQTRIDEHTAGGQMGMAVATTRLRGAMADLPRRFAAAGPNAIWRRTPGAIIEGVRQSHGLQDEKGRAVGGWVTITDHGPDFARPDLQPGINAPAESARYATRCHATRNGAMFGAAGRPMPAKTVEGALAQAEKQLAAQCTRYEKKYTRGGLLSGSEAIELAKLKSKGCGDTGSGTKCVLCDGAMADDPEWEDHLHMSTKGGWLPLASDNHPDTQGCFPVGPVCATRVRRSLTASGNNPHLWVGPIRQDGGS